MFSDYPCDVVNWDEHRGSYSIEDGMKLFRGKLFLEGLTTRGAFFSVGVMMMSFGISRMFSNA